MSSSPIDDLLHTSKDSRKTLLDNLDTFFDNYDLDADPKQTYKRPETFTHINFGHFNDYPVALKLMKVIPYDIIAKQKLNKRQLQTGGITDYEKEIKMLQVLDWMRKRDVIPYSLPLLFSKHVSPIELKKFVNVPELRLEEAKEEDKYAMLATRKMDFTLNKFIIKHYKSNDPDFFNDIDAVLFVVLFNVYTLNSSIGFVHCDLHISNILLAPLKEEDTLVFNINNNYFTIFSKYEIVLYDMFYSVFDNDILGRAGSTFVPKLNKLKKDHYYKNDVGLFCVTLLKYIRKCNLMNRSLESFLLNIIGGESNIVGEKGNNRLKNYTKVMNIEDIFHHSYFKVYQTSKAEIKAQSHQKYFEVKGRLAVKQS